VKATQSLVQTTWLADDPLFSCHDNVTDVNWEDVESKLYNGEYTQNEVTMISVFSYFAGYESLDSISLSDIGQLPDLDRIAILDALRIHWAGVQIQENL